MLREVGNLYSRSLRMIFQYPLIWILYLVNHLYYFAINSLTAWAKGLHRLDWLSP